MKRYLILFLAAAMLAPGCLPYPDENEPIEAFDSVITLFDWNTDLSGYVTYALSDEIIPITPDTNHIGIPSDVFEPDPEVTGYVLELIRENMNDRGYEEVQDGAQADLLINAGYVVLTTTVAQTWYCGDPWFWFWDPYWYGPGFGWGYPAYSYYYTWPCTYYYSYDVGTIMVQMLDGADVSGDSLKELWVGVFRGFATWGVSPSRIAFGVNQAFEQTPFFNPVNTQP